MIEDFKDIINAWPGGLPQFAEDIGTNANNAKQMRRNNSIDSKYWDALVSKAPGRGVDGVTPKLLVHIAAKKASRVLTVSCTAETRKSSAA